MKQEIPWNLIISKLQQEITDDENQQLMEWLSDSANKEVFDELEQVWQKVKARASGYVPDTNYYWAELSKRMKANQQQTIVAAPKASGMKLTGMIHFRRYAAVACIAFAIVLSASFYIGIMTGKPQLSEQVYSNLGGKSKALLPDGTEVWLHSNSSLAYGTDFQSEYRKVNVVGEVYFDVTHDADKPFIVQTEGMSVTVHGTKFNVEAFPESDNTLVSLLEGSVSLETGLEKRMLRPGETATYNKNSREIKIEKSDVSYLTSWASDELVFKKKPLGAVCQFLSKWYNVKINLSPELANKYMYTFTLRTESIEEILRIMSRINPIEYRFEDENVLTISPKENKLK